MSTPAETRPFITLPDDQPDYETLVDLTLAQRTELPGRFHTPVWLDATPGAFVCTVCWDEGEVTGWPCKPAIAAGRHLFGDPRDAAPVSSSEDTPARVWQEGDDEPEGVDLVHDIDALDQNELVYARRMPDGLWRWAFTLDEPLGKRGDMPWQKLFAVATGRLAEVLAEVPAGGEPA